MLTLMILFTANGLLLTAVSVPLILRVIPPNPLYGFRVKKTLDNPVTWYAANTYAGKYLGIAGLVIGISSPLIYLLPGLDIATYASICGVIALGVLFVAVVKSFLYLRSFP